MTAPRTPRQTPGAGLVSVSIMLTPDEKAELEWRAIRESRSISFLGRVAVQHYFESFPVDRPAVESPKE